MPSPIRIVIADTHSIFREGLKVCLTGEDMMVVGEASNGFEAVNVTSQTQPDVVILEIKLQGQNGIEVAKGILASMPGVKLLALTASQDEQMVMDCLKAGFHGYVIKDVERADLCKYVRAVVRGEAILDPKVAGVLMTRMRESVAAPRPREEQPLTPQQAAILRLVSQGYSNREIAMRLGVSENTVKGHIAEILGRLDARKRVDAALKANALGWI